MRKLTIREEREGDAPAIHALTKAAFAKAIRSDGNEQNIVDALRRDGDLALSLVATNMDEAIIGHIAVSPVTISDGTEGWYAAGPVSVMPTRQRVGIGSQLATEAIDRMEERGAKGLVLLGDPGYYARFGFMPDPDLVLPGVPAEYFQVRQLGDGPRPKGEVTYAPGFSAQPKG
ncbi:MAG: GNAT family N-acetyltransferase [Citromicrobium sp.]|mgnify:CR=1 FL=1|nr:GNAT family N-acetyltransferase [Citromicrobium sp.]|tara:strand:- start:113 stop:634 length:522 start_codon:yes stop_codon:yes gene_type:complete